MVINIILVYLSTALSIQIIFFLLEKYAKSAYDELFKDYYDIVNPRVLINICSFIPIYNMYFLGVLIYAFILWIIAIIKWILRENK